MKGRCCNAKHRSYPRYGGRGIHICQEWLTGFETFHGWALANGYRQGLQLDRIDNDGPYSPENCRWVTPAVNMQNSSNAKLTASAVCVIRDSLREGTPQRVLAARYGVHQSIISCISAGKIWRNVP